MLRMVSFLRVPDACDKIPGVDCVQPTRGRIVDECGGIHRRAVEYRCLKDREREKERKKFRASQISILMNDVAFGTNTRIARDKKVTPIMITHWSPTSNLRAVDCQN